MYIQKYKLIVPVQQNVDSMLFDEHDKIQCFQGNQSVKNYGVSVQGSGVWVKGVIDGKLTSYDYSALYNVYNLKNAESAKYWFVNYSKETSHDELVKTFESSQTLPMTYHLDFTIQGNDYGISSVYITYEVIRLVYNGVSKDYVVTNAASAAAKTADGNDYPGGFKPVEG